jgi:sialate O-acetylesterase
MQRRHALNVLLAFGLLAVISSAVDAAVKLPSIIGDNMVLQRDREVPIWGWDEPGTTVTVSMGGATVSAKADDEGRWLVHLPAMKAGGPHTLTVAGTDSRKVENVLVGEVWLCSGQSNMEFEVNSANNADEERAAADFPEIRHIKIPHVPADKPQQDVESGGWQVTTPETVGHFTAVGYFFGRELHNELDVPIGLIGSNWGGTRIEPWTPPVGFRHVPALANIADNLDKFPSKKDDGSINHQTPLALYNGMISPLLPYAIRGAIWYQGESNNGEGMLYYEKMKALIDGWRTVWNDPEMPFYFVQLAPYHYNGNPENLPGIWEAQTATLAVSNTGMAVTVDIGNVGDIHPKDKQDVGKRLALWALAKTYGREGLVYSGPLYRSMEIEGNSIRLRFDHVGSGLVSRDDKPLSNFTIAGEDGKFVDATAKIDGDTIVVHADGVTAPRAVRFGWNQEAEPNLSNKEGLPASPFRTDG